MANTVQICAARQNFVEMEKRFVLSTEKKENDVSPPSQPEPTVQYLEIKDTVSIILDENADLSSVLKTPSNDSPPLTDSQLEIISSPISQVSIEPEAVKHFSGKMSATKRMKNSRQRKQKLRNKAKLRVMERIE